MFVGSTTYICSMNKIKYSNEEFLRKVTPRCLSFSQLLRETGRDPIGSNLKTIKKYLIKYNIDYSHFTGKAWNVGDRFKSFSTNKRTLEEILVKDSTYSSSSGLKKRLLNEGILVYKCSNDKCNINRTWLGGDISLHLDHKNGDNLDNRIDNLRLLCPNCHSQTETYAGKNINKGNKKHKIREIKVRKAKKTFYCKCGDEIGKRAIQCVPCYKREQEQNIPTKEVLLQELKLSNFKKVGEEYNVSDNAIRKWCIKYGMSDRSKDYK